MSKTEINSTLGTLSFDIDTSSIDVAAAKLKELEEAGKRYWGSQLERGGVNMEAVQGCVTGYAIDPLESAIQSTLKAIRDEREAIVALKANSAVEIVKISDTPLYIALSGYLDNLLALQFKQLSEPTVSDRDAIFVSHLNEMTSKLQALINVTKVTSAV